MAEVTPLVFRGRKVVRRSVVVAALGFVVFAIGLIVDPRRAWLSYLMAFVFATTVCVGGLIFLMIGYAANARWMAVVRRPLEALTVPLPALAVLFLPLLFGLGWLYPWHTPPAELAHHELEILGHRRPFANVPFFAIRGIIYFAVFVIAATLLRRWSLRRDRADVDDRPAEHVLGRERAFASGMLPPVGLALTFAVFDWIMALQPVWYSSMLPVYVFAGGFLAAISLATIFAARLWAPDEAAGPLTRNHFHALGRMMFAFVVFWTYTAFFQALLIQIANKPEEVVFYLQRLEGAWEVLVWILVFGHFAVPFLILLPRYVKFRPRALAVVAGWLVFVHLIDIYWLVIPSHVSAAGGLVFHWLDLAALAAVIGTAVAVGAWRQRGVALFAERDPFFAEGRAYRSRL